MAATWSPMASEAELPSASGCRVRPDGSTERTATSVASSVPSTLAVRVVPSWNFTLIEEAPSTTCAAVTMWPFPSTTKPVPVAVADWLEPPKGEPPPADDDVIPREVMSTTPAAVLAYRARGSRAPVVLVCSLSALVAWVTVVVVVVLSFAPVSSTRPAPAPPPTMAVSATRSAMAPRLGPPALRRGGGGGRPGGAGAAAGRRGARSPGRPAGTGEVRAGGATFRAFLRMRLRGCIHMVRPPSQAHLKAVQENAEKDGPSRRVALDNRTRHEEAS